MANGPAAAPAIASLPAPALSLAQIIATALVAVLGWWVVHYLTSRRDARQKLVNLRTERLLRTYDKIERASGGMVDRETLDNLETAIADLQLLGSLEQVELAQRLARKLAGQHVGTLDISDVTKSLRDSLRRDLGLKPVKGDIITLRLTLSHDQPTPAIENDEPGDPNQ